MEVVVETPKWSFVKYRLAHGVFRRDFVSPFPTLFNYGFFSGTVSADLEPSDVIVLGPRIDRGARLELEVLGCVKFVDKGVRDDKGIVSCSKRLSSWDLVKIRVFFSVYRLFKVLYHLLSGSGFVDCRFEGVVVYDSDGAPHNTK